MGTLEQRMDDVRAVMDAVGWNAPCFLGVSEGAPLSMVFAATHPERTAGLIFVGGEVKEILEDDWPWGASTRESYEAMLDGISSGETEWGKVTRVWFAPSRESDPAVINWLSRLLRSSASPGCCGGLHAPRERESTSATWRRRSTCRRSSSTRPRMR